MKAFVYVVAGDDFDGESSHPWYVAAYATREQAEEHCRRLNERVRLKVGESRRDQAECARRQAAVRATLDPQCSMTWGNCSYEVEQIPWARYFDEYTEKHIPGQGAAPTPPP